MNEWNFPAVEGIHVLLKELKFGRHFKSKFLLTKAGKELIAHPARVMSQLCKTRSNTGPQKRLLDAVVAE